MPGLKTRRAWRWSLAPLLVASVAVAAFVGGAAGGARDEGPPDHLTIAYQPGVGYAPLIIIKQQRTIEKQFPGTKIDWKVLASGAAITNGVIAGDIDLGATGVGPLLVGWARGVGWKFLTTLEDGDLWLMAKDPKIKTLADLKGKRIALPAPTSIQAVILQKAAKEKLGDAHALDSTFVSLDHPDGVAALLNGQIQAHMTSPPFQFIEKEKGAHVVAHSSTFFGKHTFLGVVMTQKFYDAHTTFAKKLYADIQVAERLLIKKPGRAASILSVDSNGKTTPYGFRRYVTNKSLTWSTKPHGLMKFARFMYEIGSIKKLPGSWKDLTFPTLYNSKGS